MRGAKAEERDWRKKWYKPGAEVMRLDRKQEKRERRSCMTQKCGAIGRSRKAREPSGRLRGAEEKSESGRTERVERAEERMYE